MARPRAKSVRFSELDTYMGGGTPSPTLSSSTLSSPELSSPLCLSPVRLPNTPQGDLCGGLLSPIDGPLELDLSLVVPPPNHLPLFTYDLMRNPQASGSQAIVPSLPKATLMRPAVTPPVAKMTIVVKTEPFQWSMEIKPKYSGGEYVAVKDVLYGIYDDLQTQVSPGDYQAIVAAAKEKVALAYQRRCQRLRTREKKDESGEGIKRIDFLYDAYRFRGIVLDAMVGMWQLEVDEP